MTVLGAALLLLLSGDAAATGPAGRPSHAEWRALASVGQDGLYRLEYAGLRRREPVFRLNGAGPARTAADWLAADTGLGAGFYFFESRDGRSPQGGGGELTPPIRLRCRGREPGLLLSGFAYFNAERVECRCWRRRAVDPYPRDPGHGLPPVHANGVLYNEGDLVLSSGFRLAGAAGAGGALELRGRAEVVINPRSPVPFPRRRFPPASWAMDSPVPTTWPLEAPEPDPTP